MKYRSIGKTSIRVSEIGFGAWSVGTNWWAENSENIETRMLEEAVERGVNFFDTSNVYGDGRSEAILGNFIKGRREEFVIASKFGYIVDAPRTGGAHSERPQLFTAEHMKSSLERTLRNLGTDYIDLYQLHNPKMDAIENDELFAELEHLVDENIIRAYGVALGPAIGWKEEGLKAIRERGISTLQSVYNILEQEPGLSLFGECGARGVSGLVRVPHASGALDERFNISEKLRSDDHRNFRTRKWLEEMSGFSRRLAAMAEENGLKLTQLAVAFALSNSAVASVLPTFPSEEDVELFISEESMRGLSPAMQHEINSIYEEARKIVV
ncbi:MAG: aldo/keto reductase [Thermoplasmata archaeon]|uniref:Aldo/keto reductase n=1 Tax=Candidatus Sysuiplasma superficiale TaxID=2823368 RepID=A0A8J7YLZ1_9ARCH|nr:aldo/keto reductase [Candidatus Sysuiplasma superficiale]